jgi:hypothetical protein
MGPIIGGNSYAKLVHHSNLAAATHVGFCWFWSVKAITYGVTNSIARKHVVRTKDRKDSSEIARW